MNKLHDKKRTPHEPLGFICQHVWIVQPDASCESKAEIKEVEYNHFIVESNLTINIPYSFSFTDFDKALAKYNSFESGVKMYRQEDNGTEFIQTLIAMK